MRDGDDQDIWAMVYAHYISRKPIPTCLEVLKSPASSALSAIKQQNTECLQVGAKQIKETKFVLK